MKLCVFGSRSFNDYNLLKEKLDNIHKKETITEIICGKAKGADSLGEKWAKENNIKVVEFPADWDKLGKKAGFARNLEMAKYCDMGIGFSVCGSRGTAHMKECLINLGKHGWFVEL